MDAENLSFNDGSNTKIVENFGAVLPRVGITILSDGLIVESIDSSNLSCLVITSEEGNVSWILELKAEQELESLNRVVASVNEVTHEDIASVRDLTSLIKELQEIMELTMDISTNSDWSRYWLNVALFDQNFLNFLTEDSEISFRENTTTLHSV